MRERGFRHSQLAEERLEVLLHHGCGSCDCCAAPNQALRLLQREGRDCTSYGALVSLLSVCALAL